MGVATVGVLFAAVRRTAGPAAGLLAGAALALVTGALAALAAWAPGAGRLVEMAVLVAANALATVLRFVAFRSWIFRGRPDPSGRLNMTAVAAHLTARDVAGRLGVPHRDGW